MSTRPKATIPSLIFDIFNYTFMFGIVVLFLYPFVNLMVISLNEGNDAMRGGIYFWPRKFSLGAYELLAQNPKMAQGFMWSVLRVVVGTSTSLFVTGLLAFVITNQRFSGRKFLRTLFFVTMYFNGGLIPTYLLMLKLGLTDTFLVYIVPGLFNVYFMLLMSSYFQNIPDAIFDSARIDGASEFRIYLRIVMPIAVPVYAAVSIYSAVAHWNSWFDVVLYNPSGAFDTLQVLLRRILLEVEGIGLIRDQQLLYHKFSSLTPLTLNAATTMVVVLPVLLVYPFLQKYFIGGLTIGSVKG